MSDQTPRTDGAFDRIVQMFSRYAKGEIYTDDMTASLRAAQLDVRGIESDLAALREQLEAVKAERLKLHVKLIEILHQHGTGETVEHDGEKIDETVTRIVSERDQLLAQNSALLDALENCPLLFTSTCNVSEKSWINRARAAITTATRENANDRATRKEGDEICHKEHAHPAEKSTGTCLTAQTVVSKGGSEHVPTVSQPAEATLVTDETERQMNHSGLPYSATFARMRSIERQRNAALAKLEAMQSLYDTSLSAQGRLAQQSAAERAARQAAEARLAEAQKAQERMLWIERNAIFIRTKGGRELYGMDSFSHSIDDAAKEGA